MAGEIPEATSKTHDIRCQAETDVGHEHGKNFWAYTSWSGNLSKKVNELLMIMKKELSVRRLRLGGAFDASKVTLSEL